MPDKKTRVKKETSSEKKAARKLVMDLHIHTLYSIDSESELHEIIDTAKEREIDVLGITDHNTVEGALHMKRIAPDGITVLLGQEVKTTEGEIIVYGLEETLPKKKELLETCRMAKERGGFIIIPHPFDRMRSGIGNRMLDILNYIDAVEVFNAHNRLGHFNNKARAFAEKHGLPMVAGSDSHSYEEIGFTTNTVVAEPEEKSILNAIKSGNSVMVAKKSGFKYNIKLGIIKLKKKRQLRKLKKLRASASC